MLNIQPSRETFINDARAGSPSPLCAELPWQEPRRIFESIRTPYSVLLESIKGPETIARYSFVCTDPFLQIRVKNGLSHIMNDHAVSTSSRPPLKLLREYMGRYRQARTRYLPPFTGGAVGLINYDFVHYFERLPRTVIDDLQLPDAHFLFVDSIIAVDHTLKKTSILSCPGARDMVIHEDVREDNWGKYYDESCEKINRISRQLSRAQHGSHAMQNSFVDAKGRRRASVQINHEMGKAAYINIVKKAKEYIRAGDIFQANLSQRVSARVGDVRPWHIYQVLSRINPSPFAAFLDMGDYSIVSSSPERLVRVCGPVVETRPIAGTRPRGINEDDDRDMRADLLLNEKERAEHLMLIDLERNDLGRISDYSTVEVDEFMITEDYSHVIHIVSNIKGALVQGKDCFDAIRATFPGGTITGVPKVRCMEIIDELEPVARGPYTGSAGYIGFNGNMDLNIIIRTFVIKDRIAYVQAGAGIVADSDPEREYHETLKKAEALIRTLEEVT